MEMRAHKSNRTAPSVRDGCSGDQQSGVGWK